jgi:pilus assembly protein CpaB
MNRLALIIAGVAALLTAGFGYFYLQLVETELSGGTRVEVLALLQPLEAGDVIGEDALAVRSIPAAYVESRAIRASQKGRVLGLPVGNSIDAQQTLQWSDLAISGEQRRDLSSMIRSGRRAMAIRAKRGHSFSLIRPGDYVDVIGDFKDESGKGRSVVLLQRVLVLAVGNQTDSQKKKVSSREQALTLSVRLQDAQLVSVALEHGGLSVVLRNPDDQELLLDVPDMPASSLLSERARARVQRHTRSAALPVRLETAQ